MIRQYGNIFNQLDLKKNTLTFTLQTRDSLQGSFLLFAGGNNKEYVTFDTEDDI